MSVPRPMHDIGVVVALPKEAATWHARCQRAGRYRLAVSGVGPQRAALAAKGLLADGAKALLSWGVAGGLSATLQSGDLILADAVANSDGEEIPDAMWREKLAQALNQAGLTVTSGSLWSPSRAVTSVQEKQQLAACDYVAVDMESIAVARVAREAGVPFAAIKSISDPTDRTLPPDVVGLLRDDGRVRMAAVARTLARGPRMWQALRRMQGDFDMACASLSRAAAVLQLSCLP